MDVIKFKLGDWVFSDFELCQIDDMEEDRVTGVCTGMVSRSSRSLTCFPITMATKRATDTVSYWWAKIQEQKGQNWNHPALHHKLESFWRALCSTDSKDLVKLNEIHSEMHTFVTDVLKQMAEMKELVVHGIPLLRPTN